MILYSESDFGRESGPAKAEEVRDRHPFFRDYGRIIHSASFRRLQGKTQVFPGHESDFFRNRLTHSLEVAQIAEGIADHLNKVTPELRNAPENQKIDLRLCAVASLIHDLGHPPFGHNGERALDDEMKQYGGFEGNAQSLRIVARLEKKIEDADGQPLGLDLTFRALGAILKYDKKIPHSRRGNEKLVKGYYGTESDLVKSIKKSVLKTNAKSSDTFKTLECKIMDIADDIAYSTFDLEDSLKAGFLNPSDILASDESLMRKVAGKASSELGERIEWADVLSEFQDIFEPHMAPSDESMPPLGKYLDRYIAYRAIADSGYFRTRLSSQLVRDAIASVKIKINYE